MASLAIIGGTGLTSLEGLKIVGREVVHTPYGEPSGPLTHGELFGNDVTFLARHGYRHTIPPHRVNYRANLWALKHIGVTHVIAVAAVGGITQRMAPCQLAVPDQIIDYTYSRSHTFFEEGLDGVTHIDFTHPYCAEMRQALLAGGKEAGLDLVDGGTYAATQGPRLETAAEVDRLERDGCDVVGMTGMPEAALARELDLCYASLAVVANWAAGRDGKEITMEEISENLRTGMDRVRQVLKAAIPLI